MASTAVAQINVRLPRELKETGDAGLRELGLSPSDAVRLLWTRLSERGEGFAATRAFLLGEKLEVKSSSRAFDQSSLAEGWQMVATSLEMLGITGVDQGGAGVGASDADMLAKALEERMADRGLM